MMTLAERILARLRETPGASDRELADVLLGKGVHQSPVNTAARMLERSARIERRTRNDGILGNFLRDHGHEVTPTEGHAAITAAEECLSEDGLKASLEHWLSADGWVSSIAWKKVRGIDIEARRGTERWVIEVKGHGSLNAMRVNYFLAILGETLQRMDDPEARYSIALPDVQQFRRLWVRLPALAKQRTKISALFVSETGQVTIDE